MKNAKTLLCLCPGLLALSLAEDALLSKARRPEPPTLAQEHGAETPTTIAFAPAAGAELGKTFERRVELARKSQTVVMGGTETRELENVYELDDTLRLEVADTYVATASGRLDVLERRYINAVSNYAERQSDELQEGLQSIELEARSGLIGRTVMFRHDEPSGETATSFASDSADAPRKLLADLVPDTDLTCLLPKRPVSPGKSWSIPLDQLRAVLAPGGNLHLEADPKELPRGLETGATTDFSAWLDDLEGQALGTFEGLEDAHGHALARIAVQLSITSKQDQTLKARALASELSGDLGAGEDVYFDFLEVSLALEGNGVLLWDTTTGLPHSFELEGALGIVIDTGMTVTVDDTQLEIEESSALAGSLELTLSTQG